LSGGEKQFSCLVASCSPQLAVLYYVLERDAQVGSLSLAKGTVTYGFYWPDRPYNLYHWLDDKGRELGNYFNIADSTIINEEEIIWRDLVVDILVNANDRLEVLDEEELPADLSTQLGAYIKASKQHIFKNYTKIIEQSRAFLRENSLR